MTGIEVGQVWESRGDRADSGIRFRVEWIDDGVDPLVELYAITGGGPFRRYTAASNLLAAYVQIPPPPNDA